MALFKNKKQKTTNKPQPFDQRVDVEKIKMFITVVNTGNGDAIVSIFKKLGVSAQFVQRGTGTANKQVLDILGFEDNGKEVIVSLVKESLIPDAMKEVEAFFAINKRNRGIGFTVPMTSIIGVKVYQFLVDMQ